MQNRALIAAECRQLAETYKARAREPGVSQRRAAHSAKFHGPCGPTWDALDLHGRGI